MENKTKDIGELNAIYRDSEQVDKDVFAEMRSNILLYTGNHYSKKLANKRLRRDEDITVNQKIRITKNYTQKICKLCVNNILQHAPGVAIFPKNNSEVQDQKGAELYSAVWQDIKEKHRYSELAQSLCQDFVVIGETILKVTFDYSRGKFLRQEPIADENGMVVDTQNVFTGDLVWERVFGFNFRRDPAAKNMHEARWVIYIKMVDTKEIKAMLADDDDKQKLVQDSSDETYTIFDAQTENYSTSDGKVMIREYYFKPCIDYPNGYYYIATSLGILYEDELPDGIWPFVYAQFDDVPTNPRGRSIVKQIRAPQIELNRCSSKIAETQLTLGDDKIFLQSGGDLSEPKMMNGMRLFYHTGQDPVIVPGRSGEQYTGYMQTSKEEMFDLANISEDREDKMGQYEPFALLFRTMRDKKKYVIYARKWEQFLIDWCKLSLTLAKKYYSNDTIVPAIGRKEAINIDEFKNSDDLSHIIKVEANSEDLESKMGKQLMLTNMLQYMGGQLDKDTIGLIGRNLPYLNDEQIFSSMLVNYDTAVNVVLALDRGEYPDVSDLDNHEYMIARLTNRIRQGDFKLLNKDIQFNFYKQIEMHKLYLKQQQQDLQMAQSGYIPTSGALLAVDMYVPDPQNPSRTRRARLPYDAVNWLVKKLEAQGTNQAGLSEMANPVAMADVLRGMLQPQMSPQPQGITQPTAMQDVALLNQQQPI